jgi:hypothetical protein
LNWRVRAATILAVVAAHVGLLATLALQRQARERSLETFSTVWLALTDEPATQTATTSAAERRPRERERAAQRSQTRGPTVRADVLPNVRPATADASPIASDWYGAIDASVASTIAAANDRARRDRAFEPKRTPGLAEPPRWARPPPHFRWSRSRTQRIERGEDGTTILWLNDRCVLVNFILPLCAVGKIPAHGDLFKDLKLVAELGDWNDDSAERRADADLLQDFP